MSRQSYVVRWVVERSMVVIACDEDEAIRLASEDTEKPDSWDTVEDWLEAAPEQEECP